MLLLLLLLLLMADSAHHTVWVMWAAQWALITPAQAQTARCWA
jgi:hypothetical protein